MLFLLVNGVPGAFYEYDKTLDLLNEIIIEKGIKRETDKILDSEMRAQIIRSLSQEDEVAQKDEWMFLYVSEYEKENSRVFGAHRSYSCKKS